MAGCILALAFFVLKLPVSLARAPGKITLARKYARAEVVTLQPSEEICPSGGSNSPAVGARNLTQFGEKGKELRSNSIGPYAGRYGDVPWWRMSDTIPNTSP